LAIAILAVCGFAPGFFFVRRLPWSGLEKLCGSIALSLILLWLASWGVYVCTTASESAVFPFVTIASVGLGAACRREILILLRGIRVRRALAGFGFLLLWTLVLLSIIRSYSGAQWQVDWLEHFHRSLFFLHRFPPHSPLFGDYELPARPPAMNMLAAFVMAQAGDRFEVFQACFAFLNLLLFLPCCLALPILARPRRPGVLPLVALFAASPVIMENATYTWTKSLPAFFVLLAVALYVKVMRGEARYRPHLAFASLAMGLLCHYSAGPYVAFLSLHYLIFVFPKRPARWRELAWISGVSAGVLATWFAWSIPVYGMRSTVASNTSVASSKQYEGSNIEKIGGNLVDSIIPHLVRDPDMAKAFGQGNVWGQVRDHTFVIYQVNLIFRMGALGGFAVLWLLAATLRKPFGRGGERAFWIGLIAWSVVVGIAVVGERDPLGVGHLTLLPIAALGLSLLASRFGSSRTLAAVAIAGCVIDFSMGVFLQARIEHLENTPERTVFGGLTLANGQFQAGRQSQDSLFPAAWENWMRKHQYRLAEEWTRGVDSHATADHTLDAARSAARDRLAVLHADDDRYWHGWYRRHGGEVEYLGDHFGSGDATSAVLVALFAGILWKLARAMPAARRAAALQPVPMAKAARKRARR
jgi:hypothetical protein